MRREHLREWDELCLREISQRRTHLRLPVGQSNPQNHHRAGANDQIARHKKDRPVEIYFQEGTSILSLSGGWPGRQGRLRIRAPRPESAEEGQGKASGSANV